MNQRLREPTSQLPVIQTALASVVRGQPRAIELLLTGLLAGGHVLIEDVPGVGKTTLAKAMSRVFDVDFSRIQFTPDLLPADVLGSQVLNPKDGSFSFQPGPVFTHVLLADEINRASPRTQSALLEAMNEDQVTTDGVTRKLPHPFFVIATQNPVDFQGTYPLPEAQLDRFVLRFGLGYPSFDEELAMLSDRKQNDPLEQLSPLANVELLLDLQRATREVEVKEAVSRYLLALVRATRERPELTLGVSPRGALALTRAAQARALLHGRNFVTPDDIQALAEPVLSHRVLLSRDSRFGGSDAVGILKEVVLQVPVPT
ncbi:MAG: MoxR family ATPase [Polyangiaceae bacterium]